METYKPDVMLYHANCADGFGAAWAAWMKWGDAVDYRPVSYGQEPPTDLAGKHILIGDFSFKQDVLISLGKQVKSLIILDHHKTAREDLRNFVHDDVSGDFWVGDDPMKTVRWFDDHQGIPVVALFDMERSGARLVWEFCHEQPAPRLIELIEDRDLWRFNFEDTKPFGLWLRSEPFDFERWELISQELGDARDNERLLSEARAMQRFFDQKVSEIASLSRQAEVGGHSVPVCNCPPMFASEVGHALLEKHPAAPFVACYSDQGKARGYSLRSSDDRMDVSQVAKKFGGGGHRNAAGFGVPIP